MDKKEARLKYKEIYGKNAPGFMKLETLLSKIELWEQNKNIENSNNITTINNLYDNKLPSKDFVKPNKMTTRHYNTLKSKWLI